MGLTPIEQNYNFLGLTGSTRGVSSISRTFAAPAYGTGEGSGGIGGVNLENKTGTSNQSAVLPGGRQTVMARELDFNA